jgi:hypothetical protein
VVRLEPILTEPYVWRAALRTKKDPQGALADIDQALRLNLKLMQAYVQRALVRIIVSDRQGAIADSQTTVDFSNLKTISFRLKFLECSLKNFELYHNFSEKWLKL